MNPFTAGVATLQVLLVFSIYASSAQLPIPAAASPTNSLVLPAGITFIDTSFENASPLWYEVVADGTINLHLLYDHERGSPNRAAGHVHFRVEGTPGTRLTLEFRNLDNIYNGRPGSVARELKTMVISEDGRTWNPVVLDSLPDNRVRLNLILPSPCLYVARVEPYRLSDLDQLLAKIKNHKRIRLEQIGATAEGRPLEIVQIGSPGAPHRVFLRARAHPWESGGNWVLEGLIDRLLQPGGEKQYADLCIFVLPLANKDGVAHGRTRFNLRGKDLNREWGTPADRALAPENHALEKWLEKKIADGRAPQLAMELHNDGSGRLHISRPPVPRLEQHLKRMQLLESLLRKHTWFTEGSTTGTYRNTGTLGEGWLERYGIDAVVHEFNCNWIEGLNDYPSAKHWRDYGAALADVFLAYFAEL
jgi:hypothetical protein